MINDIYHYDKNPLWVYRLFSLRSEHLITGEKLHFEPIPDHIPKDDWVKSSLRIKHLASLTEEFRNLRFNKYLQADPNCKYQDSYRNLLDPPKNVRKWEFPLNNKFLYEE